MAVFVKITNNNIDDPIPRYCMAAVYVNVKQGEDGKLLYDTCNKEVGYEFDENGSSNKINHDLFSDNLQYDMRNSLSKFEKAVPFTEEEEEINGYFKEIGVQEQFSPDSLHCEINIDSL